MANFVATLSKLTGLANYLFWKIYVKSIFALIIYFGAIFTAKDMLNTLVLSQTTDVNKVTKRNFLSFQALAIFNSILPDKLLIYDCYKLKTLGLVKRKNLILG